jgi:hypothetical protein
MWTQDENVGDSFQTKIKRGEYTVTKVWVADAWELIIKKKNLQT